MKYQMAPMWFSKDFKKDKVFRTSQDTRCLNVLLNRSSVAGFAVVDGRRTARYAAQKLAIDRRQRFPQFAGCCFIPCANVNANNLTLCLHQALTEPTACFLCFLPMTITHRIETLTLPLFLGVTCMLQITLAYFSLTSRKQPLFRNLCCTSDSGQRNAFHDRSISSRVAKVDRFFSRWFDELSSAVKAFEPLFTVVDATILNGLGRRTNGVGRHGRRTTRNSTSRSLHL